MKCCVIHHSRINILFLCEWNVSSSFLLAVTLTPYLMTLYFPLIFHLILRQSKLHFPSIRHAHCEPKHVRLDRNVHFFLSYFNNGVSQRNCFYIQCFGNETKTTSQFPFSLIKAQAEAGIHPSTPNSNLSWSLYRDRTNSYSVTISCWCTGEGFLYSAPATMAHQYISLPPSASYYYNIREITFGATEINVLSIFF